VLLLASSLVSRVWTDTFSFHRSRRGRALTTTTIKYGTSFNLRSQRAPSLVLSVMVHYASRIQFRALLLLYKSFILCVDELLNRSKIKM
jgi:hypothetical protein